MVIFLNKTFRISYSHLVEKIWTLRNGLGTIWKIAIFWAGPPILEANEAVVFEANEAVVFEANEAVVFEVRTHCRLVLRCGRKTEGLSRSGFGWWEMMTQGCPEMWPWEFGRESWQGGAVVVAGVGRRQAVSQFFLLRGSKKYVRTLWLVGRYWRSVTHFV